MSVIEAYKKWAHIYDSNENLTRDLDQTVLPQVITDIKNKCIVEAGCGTGKNTAWFVTQAKKVIAFDLSDHMLKKARQKITAGNVEFIKHDILLKWPVDNSSADIVSINLVLEHFASVEFPVEEAYRVLKPGGTLCICELHPKKRLGGSQAKYYNSSTKTEIKVDSYLHSKEEFSASGKKAGFKDIKIQDWYDDSNKEIPRLISILLVK